MKPHVLLPLACLALAACDVEALDEEVSIRAKAKSVLVQLTGNHIADCLIVAASPEEVKALAGTGEDEADAKAKAFLRLVGDRPAYRTCISTIDPW